MKLRLGLAWRSLARSTPSCRHIREITQRAPERYVIEGPNILGTPGTLADVIGTRLKASASLQPNKKPGQFHSHVK